MIDLKHLRDDPKRFIDGAAAKGIEAAVGDPLGRGDGPNPDLRQVEGVFDLRGHNHQALIDPVEQAVAPGQGRYDESTAVADILPSERRGRLGSTVTHGRPIRYHT